MALFNLGPTDKEGLDALVEAAQQEEDIHKAAGQWAEIVRHASRLNTYGYLALARGNVAARVLQAAFEEDVKKGTARSIFETRFQHSTTTTPSLARLTRDFLTTSQFLQACYQVYAGHVQQTAFQRFAQPLYEEHADVAKKLEALQQFDASLPGLTQQLNEWNQEFDLPPFREDDFISQIHAHDKPLAEHVVTLSANVLPQILEKTPEEIATEETLNQYYWFKHHAQRYADLSSSPVQIPASDGVVSIDTYLEQMERTLAEKLTPYLQPGDDSPQSKALYCFARPVEREQDALYTRAVGLFAETMQDEKPDVLQPILSQPGFPASLEKNKAAHAAVAYATQKNPALREVIDDYLRYSRFYATILEEADESLQSSIGRLPTEAKATFPEDDREAFGIHTASFAELSKTYGTSSDDSPAPEHEHRFVHDGRVYVTVPEEPGSGKFVDDTKKSSETK